MKHLSFFFALLLFSSITLAQTWQWQNPWPQGNTFRDVAFADAVNGWAVGYCGTIYHTTDTGTTWSAQSTNLSFDLRSVSCASSQDVWIASADTLGRATVLRSTDGGQSWTPHIIPFQSELASIKFLSPSEGWVAARGALLHSTDGGDTWSLNFTASLSFFDIAFAPDGSAWAVGCSWDFENNTIYHTSDNGTSWQPQLDGIQTTLVSISSVSSSECWIGGYDRAQDGHPLLHTTDGGATWQQPLWPDQGAYFFDLAFTSPTEGWAMTYFTPIQHTTNGGQTWSPVYVQGGNMYGYQALALPTPSTVVIVGEGGLLNRSTDHGATWTPWSAGYHNDLTSVCMISSFYGFAAGTNSGILSTTNGGSTWSERTFPYGSHFLDVDFADAVNGWALGTTGILHTTNGGADWHADTTFAWVNLSRIDAVSPLTAWVAGYSGMTWHTTDGGAHWIYQSVNPNLWFFDVDFVDDQHGWIAAMGDDACSLLHTTDGGTTWSMQPLSASTYVEGVAFTDTQHGVAVGRGSQRTTDGGETWTLIPDLERVYLHSVSFADSLRGIAAGSEGVVAYTTDGGITWSMEPTGAYNVLMDACIEGNHAWAVGTFGTIIHSDQLAAAADPTSPALPEHFTLSAYPNPFNPATTIAFNLATASRIRLTIYDLAGREVQTLTDQIYSAGTHQISFDGSHLSSGLYFARLQSPSFTRTQKLILLR